MKKISLGSISPNTNNHNVLFKDTFRHEVRNTVNDQNRNLIHFKCLHFPVVVLCSELVSDAKGINTKNGAAVLHQRVFYFVVNKTALSSSSYRCIRKDT